MADEEDIVVKIEDDETAATTGADKTVAATKKGDGGTDDPLTDLKGQFATLQQTAETTSRQLTAAQTATRQAQQRAEAAERQLADTHKQAAQSSLEAIDAGIAAAKSEADSHEKEYARAAEEGDYKAMAAAQRQMAAAESRRLYLENSRDEVETRAKQVPQQHQAQRAASHDNGDALDSFIRQHTPATQDWLRKHTDYITDPVKNNKMTAAHYNAVGDGLQPDTPAYFKAVEKFLGMTDDGGDNGDGAMRPGAKAQETQKSSQREIPGRRPASSAAAPAPARGGTEGNSGDVRLTRGEATAATDGTHVWNYDDPSGKGRWKKGDPIGVQEFARRKREMQREGHYDKSYVEN